MGLWDSHLLFVLGSGIESLVLGGWAGAPSTLLASMYFLCEIVQDRATRVVLTCCFGTTHSLWTQDALRAPGSHGATATLQLELGVTSCPSAFWL